MAYETPILVTENLTKEYKKESKIPLTRRSIIKALDCLNLNIQSGEIFGYLGPNGAGKTTTFKLLLGLIYPTSGNAWIKGKSIDNVECKHYIGFLPEHPYFYDYLTGVEFLDFYAQLFGFDKKTRKHKIANLLNIMGIEEASNTQLRKYSKGMLQRIGIAQALINDPEFLILDEPMSGIDPVGRKEIRDIILRLRAEGRTVIFSTHILSDVESICDRVGILMKGKLQFMESINNLVNLELESIEITASGINDVSKEIIRSLGGEIIYDINRTVILINNINSPGSEEAIAKILATIREFGGKLVSLTSKTYSLEELFINMSKNMDDTHGRLARIKDSQVVNTASTTMD